MTTQNAILAIQAFLVKKIKESVSPNKFNAEVYLSVPSKAVFPYIKIEKMLISSKENSYWQDFIVNITLSIVSTSKNNIEYLELLELVRTKFAKVCSQEYNSVLMKTISTPEISIEENINSKNWNVIILWSLVLRFGDNC